MKLLLANPRGFCAGVHRAVETVEVALKTFSVPVYVRHEVVHNRHVVNSLKEKGAHFIEELEQAPDGSVIIFSAHGTPAAVRKEAQKRKMQWIDAACPLVTKVHMEVIKNDRLGLQTFLIGHSNHPEVIGTMGQCPADPARPMVLIETLRQAETVEAANPSRVAVVTQTTLSIDETKEMIEVLKRRFPLIHLPKKNDICYATQNRQNAVKQLAALCDLILVLGSATSSNAARLREIGEKLHVTSLLIEDIDELDAEVIANKKCVGITAGASTPEILVRKAIAKLEKQMNCTTEDLVGTAEDTVFQIPVILRNRAKSLSSSERVLHPIHPL